MKDNIFKVKRHLFFICGLVCTIFFFIITAQKFEYDAPGMEGLLYWVSQIAGILVIVPSKIILFITDGEVIPFHRTLSVIIGLGSCFILDLFIHKKTKKRLI